MDASSTSKQVPLQETRQISLPEQIRQNPHIHPDVDILEYERELVLRADMPGVDTMNIEVRFENGILMLSGKAQKRGSESEIPLIQESERADYYREFEFGEGVANEKLTAECEAGVLSIHLTKSESELSRRIEVKHV